jgi:ferredoxin-type protein NapH
MARRSLHPLDLTLRHGRAWQRSRLAFLTFSVALTVGLPLWHLHSLDGQSRWSGLASLFPTAAPPLVGAPTSILLWAIELVDPAEALAVALFRGPSWPMVWTVLPGVVLVVLLGRFFCGWACPYLPILAVSNATRWLLRKVGFEPMDRRLPRVTSRVVLVGVLAVGALLGVQLVPLVYPPAIIGREAFRLVFTGSFGVGALLVLGAFLFDTFVSRAGFCRSLCPGGAMFSVVGAASPLHVHNERSKCTDCTACDVVCNLGQSPMTNRLDSGCERCGRCVAVCPTKALSWKVTR